MRERTECCCFTPFKTSRANIFRFRRVPFDCVWTLLNIIVYPAEAGSRLKGSTALEKNVSICLQYPGNDSRYVQGAVETPNIIEQRSCQLAPRTVSMPKVGFSFEPGPRVVQGNLDDGYRDVTWLLFQHFVLSVFQ
jgi:hypothetical protein